MWICKQCGDKHGKYRATLSTWHYGTCNWCGEHKPVTESRDYGYPRLIDGGERKKNEKEM